MNKYYAVIQPLIKRISFAWLIAVVAVFFVLADLETIHLKSLGSNDAYNTLRISNILYSLSFFALLLKIGPIRMINERFNARKTTFGIYLIHLILLTHLVPEVFRSFHLHPDGMTLTELVIFGLCRFAVMYLVSMLLVRIIMKTRFKWSVGL